VIAGREIKAVSRLEAARGRGLRCLLLTPQEMVRSELNVIGRTVEEATGEVEQYLDRAFLAGCLECGSCMGWAWGFTQGSAESHGTASARGAGG